jgi:hypothetical protein
MSTNQDALIDEARAIVDERSLKLASSDHLKAVIARLHQHEIREANNLFPRKVSDNLFGTFSVSCDNCDTARHFPPYSLHDAADSLRNEGWEVVGDKLVCCECFQRNVL